MIAEGHQRETSASVDCLLALEPSRTKSCFVNDKRKDDMCKENIAHNRQVEEDSMEP